MIECLGWDGDSNTRREAVLMFVHGFDSDLMIEFCIHKNMVLKYLY